MSIPKTHKLVPTASPPAFICKQESESEISIVWQHLAPDQWNGYMDGYNLEYKIYNEEGTSYTEEKFSSETRSETITGLQPYTKYEIYLKATTRKGPGPRAWCVESTQEGSKKIFLSFLLIE